MRAAPVTPAVDPKDVKLAVDGLAALTADLYGRLRPGRGNLLVSPYAVGAALAMLAGGARGATLDRMRNALHLPPAEKLGAAYRGLAAQVAAVPRWIDPPELAVANALWVQEGHPWNAAYLTLIREAFRGSLFGADFRNAAGIAAGRINRWIEERTRGLIRDMIPPGTLGPDTRMAATTAIYFKARWAQVFREHNTKRSDFILHTGTRVQAPLMYQRGLFGLLETRTFQTLRLPYVGLMTSMYVFLPRKPDGLPELEQQLTAANLGHWTTIDDARDVEVWLPKFRFTAPTRLRQPLEALGLSDLFEPRKANFTGITEHPEGLWLTDVIHEARVEVDEVGTVAAAAAGGGGGGSRGPRTPPPPKEFRADHPFLFAIRHEPTGAILFMGRVLDPT
jgi:serpin B